MIGREAWPNLTRFASPAPIATPPFCVAFQLCFTVSIWLAAARGEFSGRERRGHHAALFYSLVESVKLAGLDRHTYLMHVFEQVPSAKSADLDSLLPWNFVTKLATNVAVGREALVYSWSRYVCRNLTDLLTDGASCEQ